MDFAQIAAGFPPGFQPPPELELLCKWVLDNGYPISGDFELCAQSHNDLRYWFGHDRVTKQFGIFGAGGDGTLYCVWKQDDGQEIIVFLGSEGDHGVLAKDFRDILRLLTIGYNVLFINNLKIPPSEKNVTPEFQQWVKETFQVTLPRTGEEITKPAKENRQDFERWIERILKL